jgi:hypothetical protein
VTLEAVAFDLAAEAVFVAGLAAVVEVAVGLAGGWALAAAALTAINRISIAFLIAWVTPACFSTGVYQVGL